MKRYLRRLMVPLLGVLVVLSIADLQSPFGQENLGVAYARAGGGGASGQGGHGGLDGKGSGVSRENARREVETRAREAEAEDREVWMIGGPGEPR